MSEASEKSAASGDHVHELLVAARRGDDSALWRLTDDIRPRIREFLTSRLEKGLTGKLDESDVIQQTLIRAIEHFREFNGQTVAEWQGWLMGIARNELLNARRYWNQQQRDLKRESHLDSQHDFGLTDQQNPTPRTSAIEQERASKLMAVIDTMPEDERQLIMWRHFQGLSHAEIAERLKITPETCRQRWKTVLDRLKRLWSSETG